MIQIFGWTILHSLWQIALIAAGYLVAKSLWKKATSLQRYYLALTAFVSSFLVPIFTFNYLWQQTVVPQISSTLAPITNESISITTTVGTTEEVVLNTTLTFADYLTICLPYLVAFWGLGVLYFTIRFFINLTRIQRLQNIDNELITGEWLAKIRAFKKQLNIEKEVQVFLSKHVKEPITFGHFKPVILLPISLMTGFNPTAIETIIVHELAHIKRHDYLINLGQSIIEIILFYHPCIWWLSKEIRAIREHCCDDLVLSMGNNRDAYVETLTALQWRRIGAVSNSLSMTASGDDGDFTRRIKRMFGVEEEGFSFRQLMGVFLVLLVMAVGGVFLQKYFQPNLGEESIEKESGIKQISDKEFQLKITDQTTKAELDEWADLVNARGIQFDFKESVFDDENKAIEIRGNYKYETDDRGGNFMGIDLPCLTIIFNLYKDQLSGPFFQHPCLKVQIDTMVVWIDGQSMGKDRSETMSELSKHGCFQGFYMSEENNSFNGTYVKTDGTTDYLEVEDVTKTPIKIILENRLVKSIEVIERNDNSLSSLIIKKEMSMKELFESAESFGKDSDTRITFNDIDFNDKNELIGKIRGTIRPNKSGVYHFFEIHDINKYSILFQASSDTILAPRYLTKGEGILSKIDNPSSESSKIKINNHTTKAELANWANTITKHGIIFNYENSVFDKHDKLIGLNGKFNGRCCFDDAFYINNLDELDVYLEVKDNYIYQPTIVSQTSENAEQLRTKMRAELMKMHHLSLLEDDLPDDFELKLNAIGKMKIQGEELDFPYIPQLIENEKFEKYIDSVAQSSVGQNESNVKLDAKTGLLLNIRNAGEKSKDLSGINPNFYPQSPNDIPKATFVKGHLVVGNNHPLINESPTQSIRTPSLTFTKKTLPTINVIDRKDVTKDTLQNYIQWDDQKFKFSATFQTGRNGKTQLKTPKIQVSKKTWDRLYTAPFTFKIENEWYKIEQMKEIVLVPFKKDPISIAEGKVGYYQSIFEFGEKNRVILSNANVGDQIYYENIDIGKDFTFGIMVEIIDNQPINATGFNAKRDVDFKDAETELSKGFTNASHTTFENWKMRKSTPSSFFGLTEEDTGLRLIGGESATFIVDGVRRSQNVPDKLNPEIIQSIDIISGTKAQLLYGVDKAVLITTKKVKSKEDAKNN